MLLRDLQARNADAFFRLLLAHTELLLPFVYTPTVGEACQQYHRLPISTRGLYIRPSDAGRCVAPRAGSMPTDPVRYQQPLSFAHG